MNDIIYVDLECDTCSNNPNKSYIINEAKHIPSGYALSVLDNSINSCIQKLCEELREIGEELFDTEEKTNDTFNTKTEKVS